MGKNQWRREICRSNGGLEAIMYGSLAYGSAVRLEFPKPDGQRRLGRVRTYVHTSCARLCRFLREKVHDAGESLLDPGSNSGTCPETKRLKASTAITSGRLRDIPVTRSRLTRVGRNRFMYGRMSAKTRKPSNRSGPGAVGHAASAQNSRDLPCPSVGSRKRHTYGVWSAWPIRRTDDMGAPSRHQQGGP